MAKRASLRASAKRRVEMVAADIVEIDVDALRAPPRPAASAPARPCSRRPRRRRASGRTRISPRRRPSRSRSCPLALAIWTTAEPTAPAAAETNTISPSLALRGVEQPEIGRAAGQARDCRGRPAARRRGWRQLVERRAPAAPPRRASRHVQHHVARREALGLRFRPPRRPRRPPSARRSGTAGHSFSRRSSGRACRGRPTASGCARGPCRRRQRRQLDLLEREILVGRHALAGGSSGARRGPSSFSVA